MEAVLLRTGSGSVSAHNCFVPASSRVSLPIHESIGGLFSCEKTHSSSPRISLHLEPKRQGIRRVSSESDVILSTIERSGGIRALSKLGSRSFPALIPEEGFATETDARSNDRRSSASEWPRNAIPVEDLEFPGGGICKNWKTGGNDGASGSVHEFGRGKKADLKKIGAYYQDMLTSNPSDSLLLRNYAKYLHEVERDMVKAEEYYGRAILANPGDGEVLSLYGKLIWETQKDEMRAKSYFDQAVHASPDDSMVLGSYAQFMWEAEEDEEDEEVACAASMAGAD